MKKLFLTIAILLFVGMSFGQYVRNIYPVATTLESFTRQIPAGSFIWLDSTETMYRLKVDVSPTKNLKWVLASSARYGLQTTSTSNITATGNASITGTLGVTGVTTLATTTIAGTLTAAAITESGKLTNSSATPMQFTSTAITKGLDFSNTKLAANQEYAAFAFGTWAVPNYVIAHTAKYVPFQMNLHVSSSNANDVANMRLRVDSDGDTACTLTPINNVELRSAMKGAAIGAHTNLGVSTSTDVATTCTGDFIAIVAKLEGAGNITSSNHVSPFMSTVTATGSGINDCGYFSPNGATVTDVVKLETVNSATVTNMLNIANTSGTTTNGLVISGTYSGSGIVNAGNTATNGGITTTAVQKVDSTKTTITAGKQVVMWMKAKATTDTCLLDNIPVGGFITVVNYPGYASNLVVSVASATSSTIRFNGSVSTTVSTGTSKRFYRYSSTVFLY